MQFLKEDDVKKFFWLTFTKELIKNSRKGYFQPPREAFKIQIRRDIRKEVTEKIAEEEKRVQEIKRDMIPSIDIIPQEETEIKKAESEEKTFSVKRVFSMAPRLVIPELHLPPSLQYLKPVPTAKDIELERLNPLVKDPVVKVIECNGSDEPIIIESPMGRKITNIMLSKEEIDRIIDKFSKESKIPSHAGIYRVVVGRLTFSAVISNVIGSKFVIRKMAYNPELVRRN